ncbi:branched-chain amino acid ABC transporter permease [Nonomuraea angiospora]|uniref:Branched-chain amino acid transport system permease protein n=1 Tax=Nonomuraea angiospora TaxID=46172 RepID=A0ABR9LYM1_9ACTN|nr:branched-chain amino acid ABC transporter permease [Nonomuraea angiospora]MBE1585744.1 branched-chain amino acid transport system permease protein [Nonomuraea angiospora]MDX3100796.1 branched-chain amino acid ABC transporter permease [Nonomuraea angiospora]
MRIASRGIPLLVACLALAYPWLVPNYYLVYAGALTVMYAAMSTSWNLLGGFTGYVSLGHSAFFGLGAYGTGLLIVRLGVPWVAALLVSAVAVTVFAVFVGVAAVRVRGASFVIVSIALVSMMNLVVQGWRSLTGGSTGLQVPSPFPDLHRGQTHIVFFYLFLALLGLALLSWWYVSRSRFGAGLRAIREDEDKAESLGVPTGAYKVTAFALSALFVSLAGGLYAVWFGSLDPIFVFSILIGSYMVLMSLLGGVRHLFGPLLGALIVAPAGEYFLIALGETQIHLTATGLLLVLVVLFMPDGILARFTRRRAGPSIPDETAEQRLQEVTR